MINPNASCLNCPYFMLYKEPDPDFDGKCRRNPPVPVELTDDGSGFAFGWPDVAADDVCGHHPHFLMG